MGEKCLGVGVRSNIAVLTVGRKRERVAIKGALGSHFGRNIIQMKKIIHAPVQIIVTVIAVRSIKRRKKVKQPLQVCFKAAQNNGQHFLTMPCSVVIMQIEINFMPSSSHIV